MTDELERRDFPQAERDEMDSSDFAGPHESFPIKSQEDVHNAAKLIGHADNPEAVKSRIKAIAKRKGFKLPDSWQSDDKKESERMPEDEAIMPDRAYLYAPITRIDDEKWEVEGVATSEAIDSYGTVFSYEASKQAFQKWIDRTANVREMHERRAVAKGIGVFFDDANKQVVVRSRVSRGAKDTWTKIQEGILQGYSVGAIKPKWGKIEREGKSYPYLEDYELTELSLVDNASNPDGHGLSLCRIDGLDESLVDVTETEQETPQTVEAVATPEIERAGAKISASTKSALHGARDAALGSAKSIMGTCGCADCMAGERMLDPDNDNDVDVPGSSLDTDADAKRIAERVFVALTARADELFRAPITRMSAISGSLARSHKDDVDLSPMQRILEAIETRMATVADKSSLDEVRASLEAVKGQVDIIAAQPASGGPILNGARPIDKRLANDPRSSNYVQRAESPLEALERLQRDGQLDTIDKQVRAAALAVVPANGRMA